MSQNSNVLRIFEQVISLNAWRSPTADEGVSTIHVDVSFLTGRLGQEEDSPVNFKLSVAQSDLIFSIASGEPLKVLQSSVAREQQPTGVVTHASASERSGTARIGMGASLTTPVSGSLEMSAQRAVSERQEISIQEAYTGMRWSQSSNAAGDYKWSFTPVGKPFLSGKPWNPATHPILSARDTRPTNSHLEPSCRVRVVCKKEDLKITELASKKKTFLNLDEFGTQRNRIAAAEALIRTLLAKRGLATSQFDDKYGDIELADALVQDGVV